MVSYILATHGCRLDVSLEVFVAPDPKTKRVSYLIVCKLVKVQLTLFKTPSSLIVLEVL